MSPEMARCLAALDISFLIPAAIVFLGPCRLKWLDGGAYVPPALAGGSCLMAAAAVYLRLHQMFCARRFLYFACQDCSSKVLFPTVLVKPHGKSLIQSGAFVALN